MMSGSSGYKKIALNPNLKMITILQRVPEGVIERTGSYTKT